MSTEHHSGRLTLFRTYAIPELHTQSNVYVANTAPGDVANARRLVACWNACDGIGTEYLEKYGLPDFAQKISDLREQRDELLKALKFLMTAHGEQLDLAFEQATAAIAKAE